MATDYFATQVFGVLIAQVDRELQDRLQATADKLISPEDGMDDAAYRGVCDQVWEMHGGEILRRMRELNIPIPESAALIWTGRPEDRPGNCQVGAGQWILGYSAEDLTHGMPLNFPDIMAMKKIPEATWWGWVQYG